VTPEGNKAIVSRLVEDLFNTGDLDVVDEVLADEYVDHTASDPDLPGPENVKRSVSEWLTAFPDTVSVVKDMVAEGDKVAARWTTQATHRSEFMDVPPSGNRIAVTWFGSLAGGDVTQTKWVEVDRIFLETSRYASVHQRIYSQNTLMGETETKSYPVQIRYAWPSELDLMARLAGLRLHGRWGGCVESRSRCRARATSRSTKDRESRPPHPADS
jgi:predicted ester cyclase